MATMDCIVAIPTRELLYEPEVAYVGVPGAAGHFGVLPGHELLVCRNGKGVISVWLDPEGKEKHEFAAFGGFTQVYDNRVRCLPRFGIEVNKIDVDIVKKKRDALAEKIEKMESDQLPDEEKSAELINFKLKLQWYDFQLNLKAQK